MDSRTNISGFFIGYLEKSKGYRLYCPSHNTRIFKTRNARFIENGEVSRSQEPRNVEIQEVRVQVQLPLSSSKVVVPPIVDQLNNGQDQQMSEQATHNEYNVNESTLDKPQEIALRRSQRERRSAISDDYVVYLQESEFDDLGILINGLMLWIMS